jgi:hypothetical protein
VRGRARGALAVGLLLLDGGQALQVAPHAGRELLALGGDHPQAGLTPSPLPARPCLGAETSAESGPLGDDEYRQGTGEQRSEDPAHGSIVAAPALPAIVRFPPFAGLEEGAPRSMKGA